MLVGVVSGCSRLPDIVSDNDRPESHRDLLQIRERADGSGSFPNRGEIPGELLLERGRDRQEIRQGYLACLGQQRNVVGQHALPPLLVSVSSRLASLDPVMN